MSENPYLRQNIDKMLAAINNLPPYCRNLEVMLASLAEKEMFFDAPYYLETYPDVRRSIIDPALHYIRHGFLEGRLPGRWTGDKERWSALCASMPASKKQDFWGFLTALKVAVETPQCLPPTPPSAGGISKILKHGSSHAFYRRQLHVDWNITNMCNYRCSYCFSHDRKIDKRKFTSFEDLKTAVDHLASLNRPTYKFTLSGGEPTIHPHFFDLIEYLHHKLAEKLNYILIITNGSRQGELYEKLAMLGNDVNINMLISLHTEHVDMGHIFELIKKVSSRITLTFNLMFNHERREQTKQIHKQLIAIRKNFPFNTNIALLRIPPHYDIIDPAYSQEDFMWREKAMAQMNAVDKESGLKAAQKNRLEEEIFIDRLRDGQFIHEIMPYAERDNFLKNGLLNFQGMKCVAGAAAVAIRPDGGIKGTQCSMTQVEHNIFKENPFEQPSFVRLIECGLKNCGCSANDSIPKFADLGEAEHFMRMLPFNG